MVHRRKASLSPARRVALVGLALVAFVPAAWAPAAWAQQGPAGRGPRPFADQLAGVAQLDGAVVRWHSRATGGVDKPRFILAHELAFAARLEALKDGLSSSAGYQDKHVKDAIIRDVTETILAELPVDPLPLPTQISEAAEQAKRDIYLRICTKRAEDCDGQALFDQALAAEGLTWEERDAYVRRRARASWYLDKMVAPMLAPSDLDLREAHQRGESPYTNARYEVVKPLLESWYVAARLSAAVDRYFRNTRSRVTIVLLRH